MRFATTAPRITRAAAAFLVLAALLAFVTLPAEAAEPTAKYAGSGHGYNDIYNGKAAGSHRFTIEGQTVTAFCIEVNKALNHGADFTLSNSRSVPGQAAYLAINHASLGTALSDVNAEHAATQVAIWRFTDNITIDETTVPWEVVRNRALELVSLAQNHSRPATDVNLTLEGTLTDDGTAAFAATFTRGGSPIASAALQFTGAVETFVETGSDGIAVATVDVAPGETADVEVIGKVNIGPGAALVPSDGSQVLVVADPVVVTRTAAASVTAPVPTTTTTEPEPTTTTEPPASTTTTTQPDEPTTTTTEPESTTTTEPPVTTTTISDPSTTTTQPNPTTTPTLGDELPYTGEDTPMWLVPVGLAALVGAIVLAARSRRAQTD